MKNRKRLKEAAFAYLYILPSFLLICTFSLIPICMDFFFSFTEYSMLSRASWSGFANYKRLFSDPYISASLRNTIVFSAVTVPLQSVLALILAAMIADSTVKTFGSFVKSALFVPVIASAVLIGNLWSMILAPTGILNSFCKVMGFNPINWLGSKQLSLLSVCFVSVWKNTGYFLVIVYAGILEIPESLYDAANVDGAGKIQQFVHITVPSLKPIMYLTVTLGTIWSFQVFDLVYTMTGGGPGLSTQTLVLTIYNNAFRNSNIGYASAVAVVLFAFVMGISMIQKKLFGRDT